MSRYREQIIVGLEIGTTKICAVIGEVRNDGTLQILGIGKADSCGVRKGEIVDFDNASKCIYDALNQAEQLCDVTIEEVFVAVTGSHIQSFSNRGSVPISGEDREVSEDDIDEVMKNAKSVSTPPDHTIIHSILEHYYIDGKAGIKNPIGQLGTVLEANYHIVHGKELRIKNTIKCVKSLDIKVDDVVLSSLASAQAILKSEEKEQGAIVIDIGGGTTDYIVYSEGAVRHTGTFAVGGDHVTNDVSIGLKLPLRQAEKMKVEHGSISRRSVAVSRTIHLKGEVGFAEREVESSQLCAIMRDRMEETLQLVYKDLKKQGLLPFVRCGVFLTGGCSRTPGLVELADEVFGMPIHLTTAQKSGGVVQVYENPEYSTAIGLINYGKKLLNERDLDQHQPMGRIGRWVFDMLQTAKSFVVSILF